MCCAVSMEQYVLCSQHALSMRDKKTFVKFKSGFAKSGHLLAVQLHRIINVYSNYISVLILTLNHP